MDKHERLEAYALAALLGAIGWCCLAVCGESSFPIVCAGYGVFCLAVAHFVLGYMNGRR